MKAQQLEQCMAPRALFGGVDNASQSVYSSDSKMLLSRPSVSGALYSFQYVAAVVFFNRYQLYCFQYTTYDVFFLCQLYCFWLLGLCPFFFFFFHAHFFYESQALHRQLCSGIFWSCICHFLVFLHPLIMLFWGGVKLQKLLSTGNYVNFELCACLLFAVCCLR